MFESLLNGYFTDSGLKQAESVCWTNALGDAAGFCQKLM